MSIVACFGFELWSFHKISPFLFRFQKFIETYQSQRLPLVSSYSVSRQRTFRYCIKSLVAGVISQSFPSTVSLDAVRRKAWGNVQSVTSSLSLTGIFFYGLSGLAGHEYTMAGGNIHQVFRIWM